MSRWEMLAVVTPSVYYERRYEMHLRGGLDPHGVMLAQIATMLANRGRTNPPYVKPGDFLSLLKPQTPTRQVQTDAEMDAVGAAAEMLIGANRG